MVDRVPGDAILNLYFCLRSEIEATSLILGQHHHLNFGTSIL